MLRLEGPHPHHTLRRQVAKFFFTSAHSYFRRRVIRIKPIASALISNADTSLNPRL